MTNNRKPLIIMAVATLAALLLLGYALSGTPEDDVRDAVKQLLAACEREDLEAVTQGISTSYAGRHGLNRDELVADAQRGFEQVKNLSVDPLPIDVEMDGSND